MGLDIRFILKGHDLYHEVQSIVQVFYPNVHYYQTDEVNQNGITVISIIENGVSKAELYENGILKAQSSLEMNYFDNKYLDDEKRELKRFIKTSIYKMLSEYTKTEISWGILTGIRPAKNVNELWKKGANNEEVMQVLTQKYLAKPEKVKLAINVAQAEEKILKSSDANTASIYIGIPFCPSRCLYCSFTSFSLKQYGARVEEYLSALIKEIEYTAQYSKRYKLESVYVGGGTPTSLSETQLEILLQKISENFDISKLKEYTVEAGRPDTITPKKLELLKQYGVSRISINPQTMNQKTLDLIGRKHTVEDIISVYHTARELGHKNINMDLILGLPEETPKDVEYTMQEIKKLNPENVTVHTLAVKRASRLKETLDGYNFTAKEDMERMLAIAGSYAESMGMYPYYMYRQKNMVGNFENVGYCKPNTEGIYNVQIMEEKQTILSAGAGSTTKLVYPDGRIERIFNVKSLEDYISRIDEMLERKRNGLPK